MSYTILPIAPVSQPTAYPVLPVKQSIAQPFKVRAVQFGDTFVRTTPTTQARTPGSYGMDRVSVQQYVPVMEKRALYNEEVGAMDRAIKQRWWPKLYRSYGTPLHDMLANPVKSGILMGAGVGAVTLLGGLLMRTGRVLTPLLALGVGGLAGILGYFERNQQNENVMDMVQRLPEGATYRDLLSDPVMHNPMTTMPGMASGMGGGSQLAGQMLTQALPVLLQSAAAYNRSWDY